jgi:hypothetical protein
MEMSEGNSLYTASETNKRAIFFFKIRGQEGKTGLGSGEDLGKG